MSTTNHKYYLGTLNNVKINSVLEITFEEYSSYKKVFAEFEEIVSDENLFQVVSLNYREFIESFLFYSANFMKVVQAEFNSTKLIAINLNRLILNFLSSSRTFWDHKETLLKRKFGERSDEYLLYKNEVSKAYDENFEYRFFYKLRNFAQHCGLPVGEPEMKSYLDEKSEPKQHFILNFDRDFLLSNFDSWGITVKKDIQSQPEKFNVMPIVEKVYKLLELINETLNSKIIEKYRTGGYVLLDLLKKVSGVVGMPCMIKSVDHDHDKTTFSFDFFPLHHIKRITGVETNVVYNNPK